MKAEDLPNVVGTFDWFTIAILVGAFVTFLILLWIKGVIDHKKAKDLAGSTSDSIAAEFKKIHDRIDEALSKKDGTNPPPPPGPTAT